MTKIILSIIFIASSVLVFVFYTRNAYQDISKTRALIESYGQALDKAKQVESKLDELIAQRNQYPKEKLERLAKLIPSSVDNIQLILDIEGVTKRYDMRMQKVNISHGSANKKEKRSDIGAGLNIGAGEEDLVQHLDLSFELVSSYDDFIRFIVDLEHSLRIVDFVNVTINAKERGRYEDTFESGIQDTNASSTSMMSDSSTYAPKYTFSVVLRTYWLSR